MKAFRYFTREEWAALSDAQRDLVRHRRMAYVALVKAEHDRRYRTTTMRDAS